MMQRLERYSLTKNSEIKPILKIMYWLGLLSREDRNTLGWK